MAFCTSCGAQVKGAFCEQCGKPVGAAAAGSAPAVAPSAPPAMTPPPMSPPPMQAAPVGAAPQMATKKTNPLVWILLVVLGLIAVGMVGCGIFVWYVARNPGVALAKMITASNPDLDVVSTDTGAGTMTIRDKKTGEEVTMSFDDIKGGKFRMRAIGKHGEVANVEIGAGAGKVPSWVPVYPGARAQGNFTATGDDGSGRGAGGVVTYESPDAPEKVTEFFKDKVNSLGMKMVSEFASAEGGMMIAQDEDEKRTLHVSVGKTGSGSTIGVTFGEKK
jgi:hypothetical protein